MRPIPAARYVAVECKVPQIGEVFGYLEHEWLAASPYEMDLPSPGFEYYPPGFRGGDDPLWVYVAIRARQRG